jgi:tetratricopeptide (TPR) repeat protein
MFHAKVSMEDPALAEALTEQALAAFRRLGDQWGIANCGQTVAMLESQRGAHREALAVIEDALPATRLIGSATDEVMLLVMAANEHDSLGERERAARTLARAHEISRAHPESHAKVYLMAAECVRARREGRLDQSQAWLDELGRAAGKTFIGPVRALLNTQQAWIMLARGNLAEAGRLLEQAFEFAIAFHYDRPDIGAVLEAQAGLELARGDARRAAWLHGLYAVVRGRELPPSVTPDLAGTAAAARAELGDAAYDAAYAEGRAVAPESALRTCGAVFGADPEEAVPGWWLLRRDHDAQM